MATTSAVSIFGGQMAAASDASDIAGQLTRYTKAINFAPENSPEYSTVATNDNARDNATSADLGSGVASILRRARTNPVVNQTAGWAATSTNRYSFPPTVHVNPGHANSVHQGAGYTGSGLGGGQVVYGQPQVVPYNNGGFVGNYSGGTATYGQTTQVQTSGPVPVPVPVPVPAPVTVPVPAPVSQNNYSVSTTTVQTAVPVTHTPVVVKKTKNVVHPKGPLHRRGGLKLPSGVGFADEIRFDVFGDIHAYYASTSAIVTPLINSKFSGEVIAELLETDAGLIDNVSITIPPGDGSAVSAITTVASGGDGMAIVDITDAMGVAFKSSYDSNDLSKLGLVLGDQVFNKYAFGRANFAVSASVFDPIANGMLDFVNAKSKAYYAKNPLKALIGARGGLRYDLYDQNIISFDAEGYYKSQNLTVKVGNMSDITMKHIHAERAKRPYRNAALVPFGESFTTADLMNSYGVAAKANFESLGAGIYFDVEGQANVDKTWAVAGRVGAKLPISRHMAAKFETSGFYDSKNAFGAEVAAKLLLDNGIGVKTWINGAQDADAERYIQGGVGVGFGGLELAADYTRYQTNFFGTDWLFTGGGTPQTQGIYSLTHVTKDPHFAMDTIAVRGRYRMNENSYAEVAASRDTSDLFNSRTTLSTTVKVLF